MPILTELFNKNYDFLQDWYWNNTYYTGYIVLFFTNKQVFLNFLPIVIISIIVITVSMYILYIFVWSRIFPLYMKIDNDKETEERRVYWYELNIFTRIADKIEYKLNGKKPDRTNIKVYLNYGIINPFVPLNSMKILYVDRSQFIERTNKYLKVKDSGLWEQIDKRHMRTSKTILQSIDIDNKQLAKWIQEDFIELATATAEGSKADPHIRKLFLTQSGGFMLPKPAKDDLKDIKEAFDERRKNKKLTGS